VLTLFSKKITQYDIFSMIMHEHEGAIDDLTESLKAYSGKGDDKKAMLSNGLKIVHEESGLIYTVKSLLASQDNKITLVVVKPDGEELKIPSSKFKKYKIA
jgi:hypothetical protein